MYSKKLKNYINEDVRATIVDLILEIEMASNIFPGIDFVTDKLKDYKN